MLKALYSLIKQQVQRIKCDKAKSNLPLPQVVVVMLFSEERNVAFDDIENTRRFKLCVASSFRRLHLNLLALSRAREM